MGYRVLKEVDYLELVLLIYQTSQLKDDKLLVLYEYASNYLKDNRFSNEYSLKLEIDLRIKKPSNTQYRSLENKLEKHLAAEEITFFKVSLFDISQRGYYA